MPGALVVVLVPGGASSACRGSPIDLGDDHRIVIVA